MHMADALLAPAVAGTMYAVSAAAAGHSIYKLRKDDDPKKLPTMAVSAALVFAGQMVLPGTCAVECCFRLCWGLRQDSCP